MTYTSANSYTWAKVQVPHPFSSSNSSTCAPVDLGFPSKSISMRKPTPRAKIQCALHSPTFLTFLKQPYQYPTITKRDTPSPPQPAWNLFQKAAAKALDIMESALISRDKQNPLPKTADPGVQLAGNFSPVPEMPVRHNLPVTGTVPDCINGVYVRNGANPHFEPVAGHHFFDGDGMLHAVTINGGSVNYSCRFTETERLVQECELGKSVFPKAIGEIHGHSGIARLLLFYARGLCGLVDHSHGTGVANAGLVYFNGRLLAMSEDDLPYHVAIKPCGDLQTKGRYDFDEQLKSTMIAHPKIDPVSGELFSLSYDVVKKPYLKYFKFSKNGKKSYDVEIPLDVPTMMHDFAITENYVVIPDQQVVFKLQNMIKGGSPVIYDEKKKSRLGILPKSAKDSNSIIWVESPDTFCFHLWNAWEEAENDEVVVIGSCITPPDSIFHESDENLKSVLSEVRLNLKTAESRKRVITEQVNLEAGMVNKNKLGRKTQYAYLAIAEPWPKVSGFAKVDLSTGEIQKYMYGDKRYGGEPLFLPRNQRTEKEDDGYILAFVHDERICKSELQIVNAITLELEATVKLPSRVPYGFHGTFVSSKDLQNQVLGKLS